MYNWAVMPVNRVQNINTQETWLPDIKTIGNMIIERGSMAALLPINAIAFNEMSHTLCIGQSHLCSQDMQGAFGGVPSIACQTEFLTG